MTMIKIQPRRMNRTLPALLMVIMTCSWLPVYAAQDTLSLNGYWKFNSFLGEGSNSLDVSPEEGDILIDNEQQSLIEVSGDWVFSTEPGRGSKCWGKSYYNKWFNALSDSSYFRFKTGEQQSGYFEHFIFFPWGHHNAAIVNVKHADGTYSWPFNQRNRTNTWLSLGIFKVDKASYIEFTSYTKGNVAADVIMLRPVDKEYFVATQKEIKDLVNINYGDSHWNSLKVPGHFGMLNQYANYSGKAWYRRKVNLPIDWKKAEDERIRIRFEGVYHLAKVYLNGTYLGDHQGGFTPFEFDVTDQLNYTGENVIAVEANNDYTVGATWNWGGIIRDVNLIRTSDIRVKYQYIHAEPDLTSRRANYTIQVRIENNSASTRSLELITLISKEMTLARNKLNISVEPNSVKEVAISGVLDADKVKLWHFDRPELYSLETSVSENGELLHKKIDRFGIRKFEATDSQMLLNGEPVRLVGFNRVSDHRYWGSSEPLELLQLDVDLMKTAGANFMRIMHGTQNKKLLDLCDEKGILIFEEANIRDLRNPQFTQSDFGFAKQWIREMIERDVNHPCIVGWSVGNELQDHWDYVKTTYKYAKELDPHRMALHVSNRGYQKGENAHNNPLNYGDMIFQNIYQQVPGAVMDTMRSRWPNKAMFISEFGMAELSRFKNDGLDNEFVQLGDWYNNFRHQRLFVNGASIWTYNDYRSGYTQSLPCENRAWGMVNGWRTKRRYFYRHQLENSPVSNFSIENIDLEKANATVSFIIREADDFPVFTMTDYTLSLILIGRNGNILLNNETSLPVLKPGDGKFSAQLKWGHVEEEIFEAQVKLVSTNGYTRAEQRIHFDVPEPPEIAEVKTSENKIRVHYTRTFDAFEYYLTYNIDGVDKESDKTIANYIDLEGLPAGRNIKIHLVACNDKGESKSSKTVTIKTEGKPLAPVIWDGFIADNKLVVGYSGAWEDNQYTLRYGSSIDRLTKMVTSNTRGIMTVDLAGEQSVFFQINTTTEKGESQWSNTVEAREGKFRIYE